MNNKFLCISLLFCTIIFMSSCRTFSEEVGMTYMKNSESELVQALNQKYSLKVKPDDELQINISSTVPQATSHFNLPAVNFIGRSDKKVESSESISTYTVSETGHIVIPSIGKVHVEGMTPDEISEMIKDKISETVKDPIVKVDIKGFHVVVLGAVGSAGTKTFQGQRCSIFDALGAAGDISLHGRRDNLILMRENNGIVEKHVLDLTDSSIFQSPYYYLQQNDVLIVDATDVHKENSTYNSMNSFRLQTTSTIVSVVSVIASLGIALLFK